MAGVEDVILRTLVRVGVLAYLAEVGLVDETVHTAGEHLVGEVLVRHVEDDFVRRGVEHIVHGYNGLGVAQVGAHVAADERRTVESGLAHLPRKVFKFGHRQTFDVAGAADILDVHIPWFYWIV